MVRTYALFAWTWTRAAAQYPLSLILLTLGTGIVGMLDVAAIGVIFVHIDRLGGFELAEVMFLYGSARVSFALSDMLFGTVDRLGAHIRAGSFDVMLIRPVSPMIQLATDQFSPRRLGQITQAAVVFGIALAHLDVGTRWWMTPVMIFCGTVIFMGIWTLGAAFQFLATDAPEVVNAFTYGGVTLAQYPMSVYGGDLVRAVTWTIPLAFVNWQPALYVLGHPDPFGLPAGLRFASPIAAGLLAGAAALAWRYGVRQYRSTGS